MGWKGERQRHAMAARGIPSSVRDAKDSWEYARKNRLTPSQYKKIAQEKYKEIEKAQQKVKELEIELNILKNQKDEEEVKMRAQILADEVSYEIFNLTGVEMEVILPEINNLIINVDAVRRGEEDIRDYNDQIRGLLDSVIRDFLNKINTRPSHGLTATADYNINIQNVNEHGQILDMNGIINVAAYTKKEECRWSEDGYKYLQPIEAKYRWFYQDGVIIIGQEEPIQRFDKPGVNALAMYKRVTGENF